MLDDSCADTVDRHKHASSLVFEGELMDSLGSRYPHKPKQTRSRDVLLPRPTWRSNVGATEIGYFALRFLDVVDEQHQVRHLDLYVISLRFQVTRNPCERRQPSHHA